ncbi:DUF5675 family protein [Parvibaculum sp.]|uniref:DUF5675 family protein n=1 Tax=Parvibaculum sp. TaxID=2024848 RepID=UPI001D9B0625|nr:DUF5675 family protein [Parvibaculum sp.]MBX3490917.1 hypothetical protein [Parvibaculum sp.]
MSEITFALDRLEHDGLATRGELSVGGRLLCLTLEDRFRAAPKVPGETRIPAGLYRLELKPIGTSRFDAQAARIMAKAGGDHLGMVRLMAVPNFSEILIHWGNYHTNSEGCILTGRGKMTGPDGALAVSASQDAYAAVYPVLARAAHAAGPGAWLRIADNDGTGAKKSPLPLARPGGN